MNILIVSATPFEIAPLLALLDASAASPEPLKYLWNGHEIDILITGAGIPATLWRLGRQLAGKRPDWVLNAGIAGAFDGNLAIGETVHVVSERWGDVGVEEADGRFTDLFELGLVGLQEAPYINGVLYNPAAAGAHFLPTVHGLTVNKVHGSQTSIDVIRTKYPSIQVESMEGAAFFYACLLSEIPFTEIRSVSNYVEPRNREAWNIPLAIENLNQTLTEMLLTLPVQ